MGTIDRDQELLAAQRFARARRQQQHSTLQAEALMLDRRRGFLAPTDRGFLESIIEDSDLMPMRYFALGQVAAAAVGRIFLQAPDGQGSGFASGFLVAPGLLCTNWHVLRTAEWARGATLTMDAEDDIDGIPKPPRVFRLAPERLFLCDESLDFAFSAVATRAVDGTPLSRYGYLRLFGETGKIVRGEYATIIQHPNGRQKHIASRNNRIDVYPYDDDLTGEEKALNNYLYYSTDTLKGSSGSPVFSDQWFVVALHRRGVPEVGTDEHGKPVVLRKLLALAATDDPKAHAREARRPAAPDDPEEVISYVSNEGVRISRVLARVAALATTGPRDQAPSARRLLDAVTEAATSVEDGPFARPTARVTVLDDRDQAVAGGADGESFEIAHRKIELFPEQTGYDEKFLTGHLIPLPTPSAHLRTELAPRLDHPDRYLLPFRHFTTAMHAGRRLPIFAAVNIDGKKVPDGAMPKRPPWSLDPRIDESHQPDDSIFSNMLQRGHMAAREYVYWGGAAAEIAQADLHSFTLTNVCPQIRKFNASVEWYKIERQVAGGAQQERTRVTEFVGPILRSTDPSYDDLRGGGHHAPTGIRIPLRFWKLVCWVENGVLKHEGFLLDQRDELQAAGPLEISFTVPVGVVTATVKQIEDLTDLNFSGIG